MIDITRSILGGLAPEWVIVLLAYLLTAGVLLLLAPLITMGMVWMERRLIARMQDRIGPNRVGPAGTLQLIADTVKLFGKEDIVPRQADRWLHLLAPVVALAPVLLLLTVMPWARGVSPTSIDVGVLFVIAVSSVSTVGLLMAGWGSNNRFALLGALRAVAQMISYEIPALFGLLSIVLVAGTMSLPRLPEAQAGLPLLGTVLPAAPDLGLGWFVFTPVGLVGFLIVFIAALAECERTPFDIPEADSEIVAGYLTEYSGMKFSLFYMGQFVLCFLLCMLTAIVFLGGWQGPGVAQLAASEGAGPLLAGLLSLLYMLIKTLTLFFVMILLRGTLPRLRVDQLMGFAWKFLLPLALFNLLSAAVWVMLSGWGAAQGLPALDGMPALQRRLLALAVTALLNVGALAAVLRLNRPRGVGELAVAAGARA